MRGKRPFESRDKEVGSSLHRINVAKNVRTDDTLLKICYTVGSGTGRKKSEQVEMKF